MELDKNETRLGTIWLICAGTFGVLFTIFLASADFKMTYSTSEIEHNNTMHELRLAQTSLASTQTK